ncbi:MAG: ABC transporter permease [Bacteroidales bacterium]|nr:ABC transporter permease [Bacteroidales bacterium]
MFKNYLKASWRNLKRDTSYSLINIAGLAVGIAACLLITLYIVDELSYDRFHEKSGRIHRAYVEGQFGNNTFRTVLTPNPLKGALLKEFSEVESATHFFHRDQVMVEYDDKRFVENRVFYTGSDFFKVFTFPLIKGNPKNILSEPNQVVLTQSMARKYFGKQDAMGKMITMQGDQPFRVTGICEDVPDNSHFHFDFLASYSSTENSQDIRWVNSNVYTYFTLRKGVDPGAFEEKLNLLVEEYVGPQVVEWLGINMEDFTSQGNSYAFLMQPLEKIYLHSDINDEIEPVSDISRIWYFSVIAVFILLIACINFMNLATAKYANRAREVGIRKVVGSRRGQLVSQFLTESVLVSILAVGGSLVLLELFLPVFNNLSQKSLEVGYFADWHFVPMLLLLSLFVGLLAGSYPAFFLSSFNAIKIFKQDVNRGIKGNRLRGILVTSQFVITIVLFISTVVIYQQNHFMTHKNLGFDKEKVLIVDRPYHLENPSSFMEELERHPSVAGASLSGSIPGRDYGGSTLQVEGRSSEDMVFFAMNYVEEDYLKAMGLKLLKGRFFSSEYSDNAGSVVINQKAASELGFDDPLGKYLQQGEDRFKIIGVIENHHYESLHKQVRPLGLRYYEGKYFQYMPVKIRTVNMQESISYIRDTWDTFSKGQPFTYFFLDRDYEQLYNSEMRTARILTIFSGLAIFIACLGLFGLSAFMAEKRTREIGIRKAMGARIINILTILYKEVFVLLIASTLIAWPLTYYLMSRWLENFAFRIELSLLPFIGASILALIIAVATTSTQALKAAYTNPAETLRDE